MLNEEGSLKYIGSIKDLNYFNVIMHFLYKPNILAI